MSAKPSWFFRGAIFILAFLSFACLLGTFYGLWEMRWFGCAILIPSSLLLLGIAAFTNRAWDRPGGWVLEGAIAGLIAALAYDLYRLPFVLAGYPLFKVFPIFGELLLNDTEPRWLVHGLGWLYHFSNGACLGIMFMAMCPTRNRKVIFWGCIAWACIVEVILLLTNYTQFFGLPFNGMFIFLTGSAHIIFGIVLGFWLIKRVPQLSTISPGFET